MMYLMAQEKENHFIVFFRIFLYSIFLWRCVRIKQHDTISPSSIFFIIVLSTEKTELFEKHRLQPLNYSYSKNKWSFFLFNFRKIILYKYTVRSSGSSCSIFFVCFAFVNFCFYKHKLLLCHVVRCLSIMKYFFFVNLCKGFFFWHYPFHFLTFFVMLFRKEDMYNLASLGHKFDDSIRHCFLN